eukprot:5304728-Alexandrium_andersonii.AAC.1
MSASLVGSEMCIRDSLGFAAKECCRRMSTPPPRPIGRLSCVWPGIWPVSYTHLTLPTICSV